MTKTSKNPAVVQPGRERSRRTGGEEVSDPHPGSVSDGTYPEASETKLPGGTDDLSADRQPT